MHMNLRFIEELALSKAQHLIPWMIVSPGQDWRELPEGHRARILELVTFLDINVSRQPSDILCGES